MRIEISAKRRKKTVAVSAKLRAGGKTFALTEVKLSTENRTATKKLKSGPVRAEIRFSLKNTAVEVQAKAHLKTPFGKKKLGTAKATAKIH